MTELIFRKEKMITIREIANTLKQLKCQISDEYRAHPEAELPSMQVTFATTDGSAWNYQTGDTSYSGAAYFHTQWSQVDLYRRSNTRNLARDVVKELKELAENFKG